MQALIVIDVQNDFCPGGALAVTDGDVIVPGINALMNECDAVILTQDWHPAGHSSFASSHPGKTPMEMMEMPYGPQVLWPDHCIQGSMGAKFHSDLHQDRADLIIRKGYNPAIDSYSAFFENDHETPTGLEGYLRTRGITRSDDGWARIGLLRELLCCRCGQVGVRRHRATGSVSGDRPERITGGSGRWDEACGCDARLTLRTRATRVCRLQSHP